MPPAPVCPPCPVCGHAFAALAPHKAGFALDCARCGRFVLTEECIEDLNDELKQVRSGREILSHVMRRMADRGEGALLTSQLLRDILKCERLPTLQGQLDNLILYMGTLTSPRESVQPDDACIARIGAKDIAGLAFIIQAAEDAGLTRPFHGESAVKYPNTGPNHPPTIFGSLLTFPGWQRYEELLGAKVGSNQAFMAMKFGDADLNEIVTSSIAPAVQSTGFKLLNLQENEQAGLIDDRIRVEIRRSIFLLADLTHHSNGAYWEAGYAEGLGRPVIYLCRRDVFDDKENTTHFDTNHHLTIDWAEETIQKDMERLKATIRATLPADAKLED